MATDEQLRDQVRERYAQAATAVVTGSAASCCGPTSEAGLPVITDEDNGSSCCGSDTSPTLRVEEPFGSGLYDAADADSLPTEALLASLGCGNPIAVADLHEGETVLDLGSGGGIDVLLSARRVGSTGFVYGLDMTDEMLQLARSNSSSASATNVQFLKGHIEAIPLPDQSVDVVISNCVINLSTDKPAVLAEMQRVLRPGGRVGVSDVVAEDELSPADRAQRGSYVGCIAGALSRSEYLHGLSDAGFVDASVEFTHEAARGMHGAIVRATKPQNMA